MGCQDILHHLVPADGIMSAMGARLFLGIALAYFGALLLPKALLLADYEHHKKVALN